MAPRKNKRNKAGMAIAQAIINEYQPQTAEDMQGEPWMSGSATGSMWSSCSIMEAPSGK